MPGDTLWVLLPPGEAHVAQHLRALLRRSLNETRRDLRDVVAVSDQALGHATASFETHLGQRVFFGDLEGGAYFTFFPKLPQQPEGSAVASHRLFCRNHV